MIEENHSVAEDRDRFVRAALGRIAARETAGQGCSSREAPLMECVGVDGRVCEDAEPFVDTYLCLCTRRKSPTDPCPR